VIDISKKRMSRSRSLQNLINEIKQSHNISALESTVVASGHLLTIKMLHYKVV
jgi:hypothetical protein